MRRCASEIVERNAVYETGLPKSGEDYALTMNSLRARAFNESTREHERQLYVLSLGSQHVESSGQCSHGVVTVSCACRIWQSLYRDRSYWMWQGVQKDALDPSEYTIDHTKRLRAFVNAVQCSFKDFPNWAHAASMSYFMTQPHMQPSPASEERPEEPPELDFFIRQESFSQDVMEMMRKIGFSEEELRSSKCQLHHRNTASETRRGLLTAEEYLNILSKDEELLLKVCHIYIQDFVCFGYEMPNPCQQLMNFL
eukprot:scaffold1017_cov374-Prasinococcus_capsulatus_cf.AAC.24